MPASGWRSHTRGKHRTICQLQLLVSPFSPTGRNLNSGGGCWAQPHRNVLDTLGLVCPLFSATGWGWNVSGQIGPFVGTNVNALRRGRYAHGPGGRQPCSQYVTVPAALAVPQPEGFSATEAATILSQNFPDGVTLCPGSRSPRYNQGECGVVIPFGRLEPPAWRQCRLPCTGARKCLRHCQPP